MRHEAQEERENLHEILVRKSEGTRPIRRYRHRWEFNIKLYIKETWCEDMD